ncbi:MAG: DUF883 domain-containing protein [Ferrovum sp.]|nr:DUF883 domain-containing protein [Ferrovum sp.]NDU87057.1 DUF883 domain-containing protein [Ferrovum sp.]
MKAIEFDKEISRNLLSDEVTKEQLIADVMVVVADAEALLMASANQGGEKLAEVRARAGESLNAVKAKIAATQTQIVAKTKTVSDMTDAYVHSNPWSAIGASAGIGLIIGLLIGRR